MDTSEELWLKYRQELQRFIVTRIQDRDSAEDLVHEVLVRAYERRDQLQDPARLRAWLYGITRNAIVDHYRARRPQESLPDDLAAESEDIATQASQQLARCMQPLIGRLPEQYGEALRLADLDGIPQAQIADRMSLSLSGAKSRVQRARGMLKNALLDCCRLEFDHKGRLSDYDRGEQCETGCGSNADPSPCSRN